MRIHELGKELGIESKVIIEYLQGLGADVKSSVNVVNDSMAEKVRKQFSKKNESKKAALPAGAVPVKGVAPVPSMPKVKAVAIPGGIVRAAERVKPANVEPKDEKPEPAAVQDSPEETAPVKKETAEKKFETKEKASKAVSEPKNDEKTKVSPQNNQNQKPKKTSQTKSAQDGKKTIDPSKLPSKIRPAKDRIPDDELAEKAASSAASKSPKPEVSKETAASGDNSIKDNGEKKESEKKESEAIRSLREKLVKGSVRVSDIQVSRKSKTEGRESASGKRESQRQGASQGVQRQRNFQRPGSASMQQGSFSGRGKGAPQAAPTQDNRGRKGKNQRSDKNDKYDKFDRLENENAVAKGAKNAKKKAEEEEIKVITLSDTVTIKELASKMKVQPAALIKQLFLQGQVYTVNDSIDFDTAEAIALESDIICEHEIVIDRIADLLKEDADPEETLVKRPPVVCVMGHVDHGKTSLLDAIRKTNVIAREAGGITQAIGAYTVEINGEKITFLDTPGHEAFTAMRMRGAKSTDVAILVVAADDGVMPQTVEAINHAKAADIHVIVAVNKIDKPGANIDRVKQELSNLGLTPEDWGGNTIFVPISAKTGENIGQLLEMVILDTEILELRANPNRKARGVVIEAKLDKGRGTVATLLVQKGTLKVGDHIAMGEAYGKVRAMTNDKGQKVKEALPSTPVEITGLSAVPNAGDTFVAFATDKEAKEFASVYIEENRKKLLAGTKSKMSLDDVFDQMKAGELKNLDIILKADVQGSVEAIKDSLEKLSNDEVVVRIIHSGVGNVNESDAILASASNAIIIAFNVQPDAVAKDTIEREKVDLRKYNVIYNAIDDVELAIKGMLEPIYEEFVIGHAEVRQTFKASGVGVIAGSYVNDGVVKRDAKVRMFRGDEQLFDGKIASLKRFQDDVKEVKSGFECGIVLDGFSNIKEDDTMEFYEMREVPRQ